MMRDIISTQLIQTDVSMLISSARVRHAALNSNICTRVARKLSVICSYLSTVVMQFVYRISV